MSNQPLIDAKSAQQDPRLYGTWISDEEPSTGETFLHVGADFSHQDDPKQQPGLMQLWLVTTETKHMGKDATTWDVYSAGPPIGLSFTPLRIGETWIASINGEVSAPVPFQEIFKSESETDSTEPNREQFWFMKYEIKGDKLDYWRLDEKFVASAIKDGKIKGIVKRPGWHLVYGEMQIEITDSQENLRKFFEENLNRGLFESSTNTTFRRLRATSN